MSRLAQNTYRRLAAASAGRHLPEPANFEVLDADEAKLRSVIDETIERQSTPEERNAESTALTLLGVVPRGFTVETVLEDILAAGTLGLYDPVRKRLLLREGLDPQLTLHVIDHELVHALQDAAFDLARFEVNRIGRADQENAISMLVEGDAQAAAMLITFARGRHEELSPAIIGLLEREALHVDPDTADSARVLTRWLQIPYTLGAANMLRLSASRGWAAVDALYAKLPRSSEQMLHLDRLEAGEEPSGVEFLHEAIADICPGAQSIWQDELGELAWLAMLAEFDADEKARRAAQGWDGDRYIAVRCLGDVNFDVLIAATHWDNDRDASEFQASLARFMQNRHGPSHAIARDGRRVFLASWSVGNETSNPHPLPRKALDRAWRSFRFAVRL